MIMNKKQQTDLTNGPIVQTLAKLALPIMASSFLGTAYNITDMAWIGVLGSKAVAGVGMGGMYVWLSQGLCSLARMGGQVNVAQSCGRGDTKAARDYASAALQLTCIFLASSNTKASCFNTRSVSTGPTNPASIAVFNT